MRNVAVSVFCVTVSTTMVACGGSPADGYTWEATASSDPPRGSEAPTEIAQPASNSPRPPGPLTRAEVEALVARGLGRFLARVEVSPVLDRAQHFVGFRLDRALDLSDWNASGADVHLGDVILRVNGIRIEHPEQALWAFERLRIAHAIEVDLVRNGTPITIRSPIVDLVAQGQPVRE